MTEIVDIVAREILDSRGNPTVEVDVMRPAQLPGLLVLDEAVGSQRVVRAAHVPPRGRGFSLGDSHGTSLAGVKMEAAASGAAD